MHHLVTTGVWWQASGTALSAAPDGGHPGPVWAMALLGQRAGPPSQPHRFAAPQLLCLLLHPADMLWLYNKKHNQNAFPAHNELGMCRTSLVFAEQPVLCIPVVGVCYGLTTTQKHTQLVSVGFLKTIQTCFFEP